jgi:hypothetical protein
LHVNLLASSFPGRNLRPAEAFGRFWTDPEKGQTLGLIAGRYFLEIGPVRTESPSIVVSRSNCALLLAVAFVFSVLRSDVSPELDSFLPPRHLDRSPALVHTSIPRLGNWSVGVQYLPANRPV